MADETTLDQRRAQKHLEDSFKAINEMNNKALNMARDFWQPMMGQPFLTFGALWARAITDGIEATAVSIHNTMQTAQQARQSAEQDTSSGSGYSYGKSQVS